MGNTYDIKIRCISSNLVHLYQIFLDIMFLKETPFNDFIKNRPDHFDSALYNHIIDPSTLTNNIPYHYIYNSMHQLSKYAGWESEFISFDSCTNNTIFMLVVKYCYCNESRYSYPLEEKSKIYPDVQFIEETTGDETSTQIYN